MSGDNQLMVTIRCLTYNHAPFIRQCLEGFVMQKTNFRFEAIVHDDASTDGTADIIREFAAKYPVIIKPILEIENQYSKHNGAIGRIMRENTHGKYVAMCEGDDYWIDPLKLQKQVDFLENHPDYGMCYTNFNLYRQKQRKMVYSIYESLPSLYPSNFSLENFIYSQGFACPASWLYRKDLSDSFKPGIRTLDGTFLLFAHFLYVTKVYYINEVTTVYRYHDKGVSHLNDYKSQYDRKKSLLASQLYLIEKYKLSSSLKDRCMQRFYSSNLPLFIIHRQWDEFEEAKRVIKNPSLIVKLCFIIGKSALGYFSIFIAYDVLKNLKGIKRSLYLKIYGYKSAG